MVDGLTSLTRNVYGSIFGKNTPLMLKDLYGNILNAAVVNGSRRLGTNSFCCLNLMTDAVTREVSTNFPFGRSLSFPFIAGNTACL